MPTGHRPVGNARISCVHLRTQGGSSPCLTLSLDQRQIEMQIRAVQLQFKRTHVAEASLWARDAALIRWETCAAAAGSCRVPRIERRAGRHEGMSQGTSAIIFQRVQFRVQRGAARADLVAGHSIRETGAAGIIPDQIVAAGDKRP